MPGVGWREGSIGHAQKYLGQKITLYDIYIEQITNLVDKNSVDDIIRKIKLIEFVKESIYYNANLSLLADRFIIDYVGGGING